MWIGDFYYVIPDSIPSLTITSIYYVIFIVLTFLLSRLFQNRLRPVILLLANSFFVYSFGINFLITLLIVTGFTYISGLLIGKTKNKYLLITSITILAGSLCYFKYAGLFLSMSVVAPLGYSFYTFKAISYLADIYKGKIKSELNPIYFADYLMFFPCVTAGPINRAEPFLKELREYNSTEYADFKSGISLVLFGIVEKTVICDFIGNISSKILNNPEFTGILAFFGIVLYSFQIYLDFDSYSNIAIGSARLFGFKLPKNFNSPYLASTLKEFWSRWHISLSTWLKDYIYIPLGGNRKGTTRHYLNIITVFIISGLWHGSTLNFLIWGLLHGLIRSLEDCISKRIKSFNKYVNYLIKPFLIVINFLIVTFLWLVFKYQTMDEVFMVLSRMINGNTFDLEIIGLTKLEIIWLFICLAFVIVSDIIRNFIDVNTLFSKMFFPFRWLVYLVLVFVYLIFGQYGGSVNAADFIYRWF